MFREQQISILKWYLKDHVTLTNITFELYCMQMYVLANHFACGINFHKCFDIKSLVCLHIILFLQWKAQTDVFLQTEFRFYWLQSKVEEVEGLSEITKINPVSERNLWTKLNFELKYVVHGLISLSAVPVCESEQHQLFNRIHPDGSCTRVQLYCKNIYYLTC